MIIRLRGHHLLCMLTYIGEGYSPAFIENYNKIAGLLSQNTVIELIDGPDDICKPNLGTPVCHCHKRSIARRDKLAIKDIAELLDLPLEIGSRFTLTPSRITAMRKAYTANEIRQICEKCSWKPLCDQVSTEGRYQNVKLKAPAV